jgi:hypothetical protein
MWSQWVVALVVIGAVLVSGCTRDPAPVRLLTNCSGNPCVFYRAAFDPSDGAPLPAGKLHAGFSGEIHVTDARIPVTARSEGFDLHTGTPEPRSLTVSGVRVDTRNPRQLVVDIDGMVADGAEIELPDGLVTDRKGRSIGALTLTVRNGVSPFLASLAGVVWEPADPTLFSPEGVTVPKGAKDQAAVRRELESRLRLRPVMTDKEVARILAQYDGEALKRKVPDHRLRAGLLMLTGTTAEFAIQFITSDTNRRNTPFAPVEVDPDVGEVGAFALVYYDYDDARLHMAFDAETAAESLEMIAIVFAHETLHSSLGEGSGVQEALAMAINTRVYQEFLTWDPAIARSPTALTRQQNALTLALRNSGRFGFPRAGLLPRPGVEDALRGAQQQPVRSFKDFIFHPNYYGGLRRDGDVGSEVLEAYYTRLSGTNDQRTRLNFDDATLRLFDEVIDNGLTELDILTVTRALKLKPVPISGRSP